MSAQEMKTKGNNAFKNKQFEEAIQFYTQAIELDQTDVSFYSNRAACYLNLKKYEEALQDGDKCIELNPQFTKGYIRKAMALKGMNKIDEAQQSLDQGLEKNPNDNLLQNEKKKLTSSQAPQFDLNSLLNNPQVQEMIRKNPQAAQQLFQNPEMLKNPQMMQMMMNLFAQQQGQQQGQQQSQQNPQGFSQFNPGTQNQQSTQNTQQQSKPKEEPKKEEPKQESEFEKLKKQGNQNYMKKKFEDAINLYDQCIALDEHELLVRNNKAACYIELKQLDKAMEVIEDAIKTYQETPMEKKKFEHLAKVLARKGRILQLQDKLDEAINMYEKSLLENYQPKISATVKELKREQKRRAELAYVNPELSEEHRNKGNEHFKNSNFADAIKEYEEAVKRNPQDVRPHNNLASCFIKLMRYDAALTEVEKCLKIDEDNIKAQIKKGQIYVFTKQYHKAVEQFNKILAKHPDNQQTKNLLRDTEMRIQSSFSGQHDEERAKRAMQDPEIQAIMMDPMVRIALESMQQNPQKAAEYLQDPTLAPKIQKLIQAGILRMG